MHRCRTAAALAALVFIAALPAGCHTVSQCPILQGMNNWMLPAPNPRPGESYQVLGKREGLRPFPVIRYNDKIYRGPTILSGQGAEALRQLGVKTVISTTPSDTTRALAKEFGFQLVEIPFGWSDMTRADLASFLTAMDSRPAPVYIESRSGSIRAGILAAHYRVHREGWTVDRAMKEFYRLDANYFDSAHVASVLRASAPAGGASASAPAGGTSASAAAGGRPKAAVSDNIP